MIEEWNFGRTHLALFWSGVVKWQWWIALFTFVYLLIKFGEASGASLASLAYEVKVRSASWALLTGFRDFAIKRSFYRANAASNRHRIHRIILTCVCLLIKLRVVRTHGAFMDIGIIKWFIMRTETHIISNNTFSWIIGTDRLILRTSLTSLICPYSGFFIRTLYPHTSISLAVDLLKWCACLTLFGGLI